MLNVLLESKVPSSRRVGGTITSALVHAALLAGAVLLTLPPEDGGAAPAPERPRDSVVYIPIARQPERPEPIRRTERNTQPSTVAQPDFPTIALVPPNVDRIETPVSHHRGDSNLPIGEGVRTDGVLGPTIGLGGPTGGVVDERQVDRSPRLIGRVVQPVFPAALRLTGRSGRVIAQFVVDTLGRAEMTDLRMIEATDPLFAESVRSALPRYRFSPGEAGGRKVRTLVQLPFDFTLTR